MTDQVLDHHIAFAASFLSRRAESRSTFLLRRSINASPLSRFSFFRLSCFAVSLMTRFFFSPPDCDGPDSARQQNGAPDRVSIAAAWIKHRDALTHYRTNSPPQCPWIWIWTCSFSPWLRCCSSHARKRKWTGMLAAVCVRRCRALSAVCVRVCV